VSKQQVSGELGNTDNSQHGESSSEFGDSTRDGISAPDTPACPHGQAEGAGVDQPTDQ
jgi:hypothetical protein